MIPLLALHTKFVCLKGDRGELLVLFIHIPDIIVWNSSEFLPSKLLPRVILGT
jgi:hypothetical protein